MKFISLIGSVPNVGRNIGVGVLVGGVGVGIFAVVNIVGFPEAEAVEGIGATAGGIAGYVATSAQCRSN